MLFLIALQFLTIIPIKVGAIHELPLHITDRMLARSMIFFPVVGLLIGGAQALVFLGIYKFLSPSVIALFLLLIPTILTGAFHIEGFADMMDGFLGGNSKDEILRIMRDSRVGAIGAVSIVCLILAKFVFLREIVEVLSPMLIAKVLLLLSCLSRWAMVVSAGMSRYARSGSGLGRPFTEGVGAKIVCLASLVPIISAVFLLRLWGILVTGIAVLVAFLVSRVASGKIGGITGDILGGVNEIAETALLLILLLSIAR